MLALSAAPPSDSTATIANFERINATRISTARTAQIRRVGQTSAAKARGSIRTITYTAASRSSSSIHSANAAPIMNSPMRKARNGLPASALSPTTITPARVRKSALALPAAEEIHVHIWSEAASSSIVSGATIAIASIASGRYPNAARTRSARSDRINACTAAANRNGSVSTAAIAAIRQ